MYQPITARRFLGSPMRRTITVFTRISASALISFFAPQVRCLFKHYTRKINFFYIFIQRYTFYLSIFLWTDSKSRTTREFTRWKKPESFIITRAKISAVRASGDTALTNFFFPDKAIIWVNTVTFSGMVASLATTISSYNCIYFFTSEDPRRNEWILIVKTTSNA